LNDEVSRWPSGTLPDGETVFVYRSDPMKPPCTSERPWASGDSRCCDLFQAVMRAAEENGRSSGSFSLLRATRHHCDWRWALTDEIPSWACRL